VSTVPSMHTPVAGDAVELQVSSDMAKRGLIVAPLLILAGYLIWGSDGAWSTAYAIALVLVNFLLSALLTGWAAGRRVVPLTVWGPAGTRAMMDHLQEAFDFDIRTRRDVDERFPATGITVVSHDITADGVVFDENGLTVTAFLVDHGVVQPAFGYRVDYRGRSVVLSGDTRVSENLISHARGTDVLIHEAIDPEALRARVDHPSAATMDAIIAHHTTPEQAGTVFRRVAPRLAVYSHAPNTARLIAQTRTTYSGPLQGPEDLLTIFIGAEIRVEHHAPLQ
jgi:ribonuclease Z